jgi:hypothetical protein
MTANIMGNLEVGAADSAPVSASTTATFNVSLSQYQGKAYVGWSENFGGMTRLAVAIYSGSPPSNPQNWLAAVEVTNQSSGTWNSGQTWGSGYSAALLGVNPSNNAWVYIGVNTPVTQ